MKRSCVHLFVAVMSTSVSLAGSFDKMVVIGDSASDVGNQAARLGYPSSPPYFNGRITNGPNFVDILAEALGLPEPVASELGGTNYAQAGAQAGTGQGTLPRQPAPNGAVQVQQVIDDGIELYEETLVVFWLGINNLNVNEDASVTASHLRDHVTTLYEHGGRNFLVSDFAGDGADVLNRAWRSKLRALENDLEGIEFARFSFLGMIVEMSGNPGKFGITDTSSRACRDCDFTATGGGSNIVPEPNSHFWWDRAHFTHGVHIELGRRAIEAAQTLSIDIEEPALQAGDADQDMDFDQIDLVQVQIAAKYLTGHAAMWGEGDWNGAPGGTLGLPPVGDGMFNQLDIVAAQQAGIYLTGPYAAVRPGGQESDGQTSIVYNPDTGELAVDAPAVTELTSINIGSAAGVFTRSAAANLGGSFDNDADGNIFKATFGGSFGSVSFGNVAETGLSRDFVSSDLTVVGSLSGGGDLGNVDLIYVPEPSTIGLVTLGLLVSLWRFRPTE